MKHEKFSEKSDAKPAVGHYVVAESTSASEVIFGSLGPMCHANGWCVIPQQRVGRRLPGVYRKEVIKWGLYQEERPAASLVDLWAKPCFNDNVALVLGAVSGNVFALDIDIRDWDLASAVEQAAFEILGFTPFKRVGNAPKRALFYRVATPEELPANSSRFFVADDGETASEHGFEILSHRKMITIYGRHHETYSRFSWDGDEQPAQSTTDEVPVVTPAQIDAFMAAVERVRPFHRQRSANGGHSFDFATIVHDGNVRIPQLKQARGWVVGADGKVSDGREAYLWDLCRILVASNAGLGLDELKSVALAEARKRVLLDSKWESRVLREIDDKVGRAHRALLDGTMPPIAAGATSIGAVGSERVEAASGYEATPLGWLPGLRSSIPTKKVAFHKRTDAMATASALAITSTADDIRARMNVVIGGLFDDFFKTALERIGEQEADENTAVDLLTWLARFPAGSGKTHHGIAAIDRLRAMVVSIAAGGSRAPIGFLTPSYENASEVVAMAEARGLTVALIEGEARSGEQDIKDRKEGREPKVLGCRWPAEKRALAESNISGRPMCETTIVTGKGDKAETKTITCPFHGRCRPHVEKEKAKTADLVVAVHAYVTCHAPEELKACRIVIIDESIGDQITGAVSFKIDDVMPRRRGIARLTKAEIAAGKEQQDFENSRDVLWEKVAPILRAGGDPARLFVRGGNDRGRPLEELLDDTIALLGRTEDNLAIRPEMKLEVIQEICKRPARTKAREELIFWRVLRSRVELLIPQVAHEDLKRETGSNVEFPKLVHGRTDKRIHCYKDGTVRVAFRVEHNFEDAHLLLLDASADANLLEKTLGRKVVVHTEEAPMRLRTVWMPGQSFSTSSLLDRDGDDEIKRIRKAESRQRLREYISTIAAFHAGGVLVCLPSKIRKLLQKRWASPANVGWMHFGATKGLNWASRYDAIITIGCIQPSAEAVDAKVAALTFDDETIQEPMVDPIGSGREEDDEREDWILAERTLRMRDGREISVRHRLPRHPIAAAVYEQVRREQSLQTIARVRPILRDEIPTLYAIGDYLPESIIVDEVVPVEDLQKSFGRAFEETRRLGSFIGDDPEAITQDREEYARTIAHIESNPRAQEVMIQARNIETGETVWAPAYNRETIERLADEGIVEIVSAPEIVEIGRPSTWNADRDFHAVRDAEAEDFRPAQWAATDAGWELDDDNSRLVVRVCEGEVVATSDVWALLHLYARNLEPPAADNDNADADAEGMMVPIAA